VSLARLEALVWVFIYGGMLVLAGGIALRATAPSLAAVAMTGGGALAVVGIVLIGVRARRVADAARRAAAPPDPQTFESSP
jgi:uncharacterized membrane protein HdeD (DUF308 family)